MDLRAPLQKFIEEAWLFIPKLITALITFGVALVLAALFARWVRSEAEKRIGDEETAP